MARRPLGDVVAELAAAVRPGEGRLPGVRVTRLSLDVPIELGLRGTVAEPELLGDLPQWRWRSVFDREPGRLSMALAEEAVPGGGEAEA